MKNYEHFGCAQDWVVYVQKYLQKFKIESILEMGVGDGTEFLLDNCSNVTSFEIIDSGVNSFWYNRCKEKYKDRENWNSICIESSPAMKKQIA